MTPLFVQAVAAWFMAGSIWTMQVLNYPLLAKIDAASFPAYEAAHNQRFVRVVGPGVLAALVGTVWLVVDKPPRLGWYAPVAAALLLAMVIVSTALYQGKAHAKLASGFDRVTHATLVRSNWVRTVAWTAMGGLDVWMLATLG